MRKKFMCILCMTLCCVGVWGCGNNKKQEIADSSQEELELEKDEVGEIDTESVDMQSEDDGTNCSEQETVPEEDEESAEKPGMSYAEPTQEILDANFEDFKFQVDTKVFRFDYDMSTEQFLKQFADTAFVFKLDNEELSLEKQVSSDDFDENIDAYLNDELCFSINVFNSDLQKNSIAIKDCVVHSIYFEKNFSGAIYFAKGIPFNNVELLEQNENLSFANLRNYLQSIGVEESRGLQSEKAFYYTENGDMEYVITPVSGYALPTTHMNGNQRVYRYCSYSLMLIMDSNAERCVEVRFWTRSQPQYEDDRE